MAKYGVISGPYLPVFNPNTGKYGPEITPYLDTSRSAFGTQKYDCVVKTKEKHLETYP